MELQDLKQKWNMLDERLSKREVYNKHALEEIIKGKNKTTYEKLYKSGIFNFFYTLFIAAVIVPLLHLRGSLSSWRSDGDLPTGCAFSLQCHEDTCRATLQSGQLQALLFL